MCNHCTRKMSTGHQPVGRLCTCWSWAGPWLLQPFLVPLSHIVWVLGWAHMHICCNDTSFFCRALPFGGAMHWEIDACGSLSLWVSVCPHSFYFVLVLFNFAFSFPLDQLLTCPLITYSADILQIWSDAEAMAFHRLLYQLCSAQLIIPSEH